MSLAAECFWPQLPVNFIAQLPHFFRLPAGKMNLKIIVNGMPLRQKTFGSKNDHSFSGNPLHVLDQLEAILLGKVLNDIERHTGIKLAGLKHICELVGITKDQLVVSLSPFRFLKVRLIALESRCVGRPHLPEFPRYAAADIQYTVTPQQSFSQCQAEQYRVRIKPLP